MGALVLDAFIDPMVGILSDRTRSRWGRRHPWMYASALPIAIGWLLLWNPPAGGPRRCLLGWLFVTAVITRSAVSCFEVPSQALTPELTTDYDERTRDHRVSLSVRLGRRAEHRAARLWRLPDRRGPIIPTGCSTRTAITISRSSRRC